MRIEIRQYGPIRSLSLDIFPVTLLVGPNGAGKTMIMRAIGLLGLPAKLADGDTAALASAYAPRGAEIATTSMKLRITRDAAVYEFVDATYSGAMKLVIPLEGERYEELLSRGLAYSIDRFPFSAALYSYSSTAVIEADKDTVEELNDALKDVGSPVVIGFDEIGPYVMAREKERVEIAGDGIASLLYYMGGISKELRFMERAEAIPGRVERKFVVLLDTPEVHVYPALLDALADKIAKAAKKGLHVVVETHSGYLASMLMERLPENMIKVYYIYNMRGHTEAIEVPLEKLARQLMLIEDILMMSAYDAVHRIKELELED